MIISSVFDSSLNKNIKYSYHKRGLNTIYNPDSVKEEKELEYYTSENGNLFLKKEVAWHDTVVLNDGVDIKIDLDEICFVDYIELKQGDGSKAASYEVFDGDMKKIGNFIPETGKTVSCEDLKINIGYYTDKIILRINGCCMPISIKNIDIWAVWEIENNIWPLPESAEIKSESYSLSLLKTIKAETDDEIFSANYFNEKLFEKEGVKLEIVSKDGDIELKTDADVEKDGYNLVSENGKICVSAKNKLNILYGLDALLQLISEGNVKNAKVKHEAFKEFRGVHFALPDRHNIDFLKKMVKYVFIPNQYNTIYLQISGGMKYDNYPEINEAWFRACDDYENGKRIKPPHYKFVAKDALTKSEVRELCDYFESFGLEVVPEIQTLAHVQYITYAFPELSEHIIPKADEGKIDLNVKDIMPEPTDHCTCPSHPDYYKVMFNIIDEIVEVVKPKRFIHMGHDEILNMGSCPECQKKAKEDIFAEEVTKLNDYVKSKGLKMIIWADMIQDMYYSVPDAIDRIPKDILMMDFVWYFFMDKNIEEKLIEHGFDVILGNYYTSHFPRFEERIVKDRVLGGEVSTWVECSEFSYAFEGKMYEFVMASTSLVNKTYKESLRLTYNEMIKPLLKDIRLTIGGLKSKEKCKIIEIAGERNNIPFDIRDIVCYDKAIKIDAKDNMVEIPVNDSAEIITVVHATDKCGKRAPWQPAFKVADYKIIYNDGSEYSEEICYAANIHKYNSTYGDRLTASFFRHEGYAGTYLAIPECGKTHNGEDYTLGHYSFKNPYPEKKIKSVKFVHAEDTDASVLIFKLCIK